MKTRSPLILVVDDEQVSRTMVCAFLTKVGLNYVQASNGERALSILQDNPDVSLIITDLQMPELSGQELFAQMRTIKAHSGTPTILVSGVVPINKIYALLEDPKVLFLPKPIDFTYLGDYLRRLLPKKAVTKQLISQTVSPN